MTVNTGVKGTLAKLLATEDLIIEHKSVSTASFDVTKRVLTLPNWEKATESVYDLLVSHEVGHALYTPADQWETMECPQSFVNVTEDARVEKLMKRKYPGLPKTFYKGYCQLQEDDFFDLNGTTKNMNLVDRINIFFKVGSFIEVNFTEEEQQFVDDTAAAETFADAIAVANAIWKYMKSKQEKKVDDITPPPVGQSGSSAEQGTEQVTEQGAEQEGEGQPENKSTDAEESEQEPGGGGVGGSTEMEATTDAAFEEAMQQLTKEQLYESVYFELPKFTYDQVVVPCDSILADHRNHFDQLRANGAEQVQIAEEEWKKFRKNSQQEVNYLVKEFECRKAASTYARTSTARTGVLDTSKLHTYKYNEDLFKRVSVIPQGKNHGMIFLVDWSGSMSGNIIDTVNQVIQLCWFCQKSNIPFDVYAFTNETYMLFKRMELNGLDNTDLGNRIIKEVPNQFALDNQFAMMHLASSKQKTRDLEDSLKYLFFNAGAIGYKGWHHLFFFFPTPGLGLSGTPLNEGLVCLHAIIPQMRRQAEKVTVCILTDGEAAGSGYWSDKWRYDGRPWANHIRNNCQLRDRKLGKIYDKFTDNYASVSETLLMNLRDRFPNVNFLGFRLLAPRESGSFFRQLFNWTYGPEYSKFVEDYKKNKYAICSLRGYHQLYVMPTSNQEDVAGMDAVSEEASKAEITRAFKKMFKSKKNNKKMLNAFVQTVA